MNGLTAKAAVVDIAPLLELPGSEKYRSAHERDQDGDGEESLDGCDDESLDSLSSWTSRRSAVVISKIQCTSSGDDGQASALHDDDKSYDDGCDDEESVLTIPACTPGGTEECPDQLTVASSANGCNIHAGPEEDLEGEEVAAEKYLADDLPFANCNEGPVKMVVATYGNGGNLHVEEDTKEVEEAAQGEDAQGEVGKKSHEADPEKVQSFFQTYHPQGQNKQPISVLQERYGNYQHQIDKQAKQESLKGWFNDVSCSDGGQGLWWSSRLVVPGDVAGYWGLDCQDGGTYTNTSDFGGPEVSPEVADTVREICGELKPMGGRVRFKTKTGARKCAALNLLWTLEFGNVRNPLLAFEGGASMDRTEGASAETDPSKRPDAKARPGERFRFLRARFHGAMKDRYGPVLSAKNPCLVQCILSVEDSERRGEPIEIWGGFHLRKDDAVDDAFGMLKARLSKMEGATDLDVRSVLVEKDVVKKNKPAMSFEAVAPRWATAPLEEQLYLYELEFHTKEAGDGDRTISMSEAMGIDAAVATRIGVVLGSDLFDSNPSIEKELCIEFTINDRRVSVRMCRRTPCSASIMARQLKRASRGTNAPVYMDAIALLIRCFNAILLWNGGKTYGSQPIPDLKDLVAETRADLCGDGRSHLFLPILRHGAGEDLQIDWKTVLETVHDVQTPAVQQYDAGVCLPYSFAFWVSLGLVLAALMAVARAVSETLEICGGPLLHQMTDPVHSCQRRECSSFDEILKFFIGVMTTAERRAAVVSCALNALLLGFHAAMVPEMASMSTLRNRFLRQPVGFRKRLFVAKEGGSSLETSRSPLVPHPTISLAPQRLKDIFCDTNKDLQLEDATHAQYYENVRGYPLRYPARPLFPAARAVKYSEHDLTQSRRICDIEPRYQGTDVASITNLLAARGYLVAELLSMLPLPRDMLYLCQHQSNFMRKLERKHLLLVAASRFRDLQKEAFDSLNEDKIELSTDELVDYIDKSTSTGTNIAGAGPSPSRIEERLESLGDSVLLFFMVLNLFVKSASMEMKYILDVFQKAITMQGKNEVLLGAGMKIGLQQLNSSSNKKISDTFEAILGAAYLIDPRCHIVIGLLNEVGSCIPRFEGEPLMSNNSMWFIGKGTCLSRSFEWTELEQISGIDTSVLSTLKANAAKLCQIFHRHSNYEEVIGMNQAESTTLTALHCALFDDSLEDGSPGNEALECLAELRDKIFFIGHAALQMKVVEEIYRRHHDATSGDIHLMKVTLLSHDTLAYVCIKNGFHECLFDTDSDAVPRMQDFMKEADALGFDEWDKHSGWIISGGSEEFRRRLQSFDVSHLTEPQYPGLAVGRLFGHDSKLPDKATEELMFSFKCIFGALVLSMGAEKAWAYMMPFFIELLLLSPDELRSSYKDSSIVQGYAKGKR